MILLKVFCVYITVTVGFPVPRADRQAGEAGAGAAGAGVHVRAEHHRGELPRGAVAAVRARHGAPLPRRSALHGPGVLPAPSAGGAPGLDAQ